VASAAGGGASGRVDSTGTGAIGEIEEEPVFEPAILIAEVEEDVGEVEVGDGSRRGSIAENRLLECAGSVGWSSKFATAVGAAGVVVVVGLVVLVDVEAEVGLWSEWEWEKPEERERAESESGREDRGDVAEDDEEDEEF